MIKYASGSVDHKLFFIYFAACQFIVALEKYSFSTLSRIFPLTVSLVI